jgi:transposase
LRAVVMESCHVGRHAKTYADNDRMAAARIALVYLAGNAPCVWVPDETTRERRELLHAYLKAVAARTAAINSLKGYLNQFTIRPGKRDLNKDATRGWVLRQRDWSTLQLELLADHFANLRQCAARRETLYRLVAGQIAGEPLMLRAMKLLGIGLVSAFALLATIGDIRRFDTPAKLVAYVGLNPGLRESGRGKHVKLGIGKRGRGDLRHLLIEGAQSVLKYGRATPLGKWGWKIFSAKGSRNVAVAAVARKQLVRVWHLLMGNAPAEVESDKSLTVKLRKLAHALGKEARRRLALPLVVPHCVEHFRSLICERAPGETAA